MSQKEIYITQLGLIPHPEGGYYRETYRSKEDFDFGKPFSGERNISTAIYFLIEKNNFSAFHKISSDELWHFYAGDSLEVIEINLKGELKITTLGNKIEKGEVFQHIVPANTWFASRVKNGGEFSLAGCTVAPGFDFSDFIMAKRENLILKFPEHKETIISLTR